MKIDYKFKLNEIVIGLEKTIIRYERFFQKYLQAHTPLIETPIGKHISNIIHENREHKPNNILSEIITFSESPNKDLVVDYNLDKIGDFIDKNPEIIEFFNDPTIKAMSDLTDDYKWMSQCLLINIDSYINMFFKLLFGIENEKNLPKGFNDDPKSNFYKNFPELQGLLDVELDYYFELHTIRNNIIHNAMFVDDKLISKLSLDLSHHSDLGMYVPNFDKVILYGIVCAEIVFVSSENLFSDINLYEDFKDKDILKYIQNYRNSRYKKCK